MKKTPRRSMPSKCRHCATKAYQADLCSNCRDVMCHDCYCYDVIAYVWFDLLEIVGGSACNSCDHEMVEGP